MRRFIVTRSLSLVVYALSFYSLSINTDFMNLYPSFGCHRHSLHRLFSVSKLSGMSKLPNPWCKLFIMISKFQSCNTFLLNSRS